jgi:hypothetical protein
MVQHVRRSGQEGGQLRTDDLEILLGPDPVKAFVSS